MTRVQSTWVSTGQLSRSHSQYYTASLLMSEATTQMSISLVNSDDRQQYVRFLRYKTCHVWWGGGDFFPGLAGKKFGHGVTVIQLRVSSYILMIDCGKEEHYILNE